MQMIYSSRGYEFWAEREAGLWCVYLEPEKECCIAECDTKADALRCAKHYVADLVEG